MSRAVLFCNGEIRDDGYHLALLNDNDFIIAVDGGGNHCFRMGINPHICIGDFDSMDPTVIKYYKEHNIECIPFPADKDYIDMILGIEEAKKRGFDEVLLLGAMGGKRSDMFLGNALALSSYDENVIMKNEFTEIRFLKEGRLCKFRGHGGDYFSVIPLSDIVETGKSVGLKYQLENLTFRRGETRSISNEFSSDSCEMVINRGEALVIVQKR